MFKFQLFFLRFPSRIRGYFVRIWILCNWGKCKGKLIVESGFRFKQPPNKNIDIGYNVCFGKQTTLDIFKDSKLVIGNDVSFTGYTYISSAYEVIIGNHVIVGEFVSIRDANHGTTLDSGYIKNQPMRPATIKFGDDIWIGRGVSVLKGVNLASGVVVGANSVVINDIKETNSINAGIPCKFIKSRN